MRKFRYSVSTAGASDIDQLIDSFRHAAKLRNVFKVSLHVTPSILAYLATALAHL